MDKDERIYSSIHNILGKIPNNAPLSRVLNDINDEYDGSLSFKELTEIAKLIEPQVTERNVLKLLMKKGD